MKELRSAYDGKKINGMSFDGIVNMTEQHHKKECDITHIINQYDRTGLITHINQSIGEYGDFSEINDYQKSMNLMMEAQERFMELPSKVRKEFDNDPGKFVEYASNEENRNEMIKMGLINEPQKEVITKVEVINKTNNKEE